VSDELGIRTPTYRPPRARRMDPTTRRLALIAAALGSALSAVIGAWSVMDHPHASSSSSLSSRGDSRPAVSTVPVIAPPSGPLRVKPVNPGGMQLSATSADLFDTGDGGQGQGRLAPSPEIPDPQALHPPSRPPVPLAAPAAVPLPSASSTPPKAPAAPFSAAATPAPAARPSQAPAASGVAVVQLAALPSAAAAKDEWVMLQLRLGPLLRDRQPLITSVDIGGRTWWRVRTGGFADAAAAKGFCEQVHAKSLGCDVVRF
jgi:hypothetical protein